MVLARVEGAGPASLDGSAGGVFRSLEFCRETESGQPEPFRVRETNSGWDAEEGAALLRGERAKVRVRAEPRSSARGWDSGC